MVINKQKQVCVRRKKLRERVAFAAEWTELDRLMFGIASFDEVMDKGVYLVLRSTKWNDALYAHDLNKRITRGMSRCECVSVIPLFLIQVEFRVLV